MTAERLFDDGANEYDAVLIVSFGGPEGRDDVTPFLDNVLRGLPVPDTARQHIARRYESFGGTSPINARTRELIAALRHEFDCRGPALPIYWGNRNWHPLLPDTLRKMKADGVRRAIAFVTSLFSSYSGCRQYRENLYDAVQGIDDPPHIDKLRNGYNHPGFISAFTERVRDALAEIPEKRRGAAQILFTAHSLPSAMARGARYEAQLAEAAGLVGLALAHPNWRLAFQSRNARYGPEEWLGPDLADAMREARDQGANDVVVAPIGFVSDHMEVVLDLDIEAKRRADDLGLRMVRAGTVGAHPAFVGMIGDLVRERMVENPARPALGRHGPSHDYCPSDCCRSGRPGQRRPALCGAPPAAAPGP